MEPCWFTKNKTHVFDCHQLRIETWTSGEFPHVTSRRKIHRLGGKNIRHLPKDTVFSQQCQRNARDRSLVELETGFCRSREKNVAQLKTHVEGEFDFANLLSFGPSLFQRLCQAGLDLSLLRPTRMAWTKAPLTGSSQL